ncbi:MAG: asparaginase [Acidobacteriota bacterium]
MAEDTSAPGGYVPLVAVLRGGHVESVHHGAIAVVDDAGRTVASAGDPGARTFLRSAAKPAQVLPLIGSGAADLFGLTEPEIAVIIGSHGGEAMHLAAVRSILSKIGLDERALQCGAHPPLHPPAARELLDRGERPLPIHNNCSGKHAGMLALAVHLGAPLDTYLDPGHPVQVRIREVVASLAGLPAASVDLAVDGCSAPTFHMPIRNAALLYARLVSTEAAGRWRAAAGRVATAMRRHPEMVAGTDRLCTALMRAAGHDLIAKIGAEGFYGLACRRGGTGMGIAIKIADGDGVRARHSAALETLRGLGILDERERVELLDRFVGPLRNRRGLPVGRVETVFRLDPAPAGRRGARADAASGGPCGPSVGPRRPAGGRRKPAPRAVTKVIS